jgi:hypothetical protein
MSDVTNDTPVPSTPSVEHSSTETDGPPFVCGVCGREFDAARGRYQHWVRSHSGRPWNTTKGHRRPPAEEFRDLLPTPRRNGKGGAGQWAELPEFRILTDGAGGIWIAERVK